MPSVIYYTLKTYISNIVVKNIFSKSFTDIVFETAGVSLNWIW